MRTHEMAVPLVAGLATSSSSEERHLAGFSRLALSVAQLSMLSSMYTRPGELATNSVCGANGEIVTEASGADPASTEPARSRLGRGGRRRLCSPGDREKGPPPSGPAPLAHSASRRHFVTAVIFVVKGLAWQELQPTS